MRLTLPSGFEVLPGEPADRIVIVRIGDHGLAAWVRGVDPEQLLEQHGEKGGGGRGSIARIALSPHGGRPRPPGTAPEPEGAGRAGEGREAGSPGHPSQEGLSSEVAATGETRSRAANDSPVTWPDSQVLVLKKYRHGGALSGVLPDVFLGCGRMLADLRTSEHARLHDVPCARVRGLMLLRSGKVFWRGYLLTEEIAGAITLDRALIALATRADGAGTTWDLAASAIRTLRRMHDAGILHRDLNMRNLLVAGSTVFVIDLDGAGMPPMTHAMRFSNLSRLDRSYVKLLGDGGPLAHDERRRLLWDYCGADDGMRRDFESRLTGHKRRLARHRLTWRAPQHPQ